jgi:hypothetical protein
MSNHPMIAAEVERELAQAAKNYAIHSHMRSRDQWAIAELAERNHAEMCKEFAEEGRPDRPTLEESDTAVAAYINDCARGTDPDNPAYYVDIISVASVKFYRTTAQHYKNVPELSSYRRLLSFDHLHKAVGLVNAGVVGSVQEALNRAVKDKLTADDMYIAFMPELLNRPPRSWTVDNYRSWIDLLKNGRSEILRPDQQAIIIPLLEQIAEVLSA